MSDPIALEQKQQAQESLTLEDELALTQDSYETGTQRTLLPTSGMRD